MCQVQTSTYNTLHDFNLKVKASVFTEIDTKHDSTGELSNNDKHFDTRFWFVEPMFKNHTNVGLHELNWKKK